MNEILIHEIKSRIRLIKNESIICAIQNKHNQELELWKNN